MKTLILFLGFFGLCQANAQHTITVNFQHVTDTMKDIMGVNRFSSEYIQGYLNSGVSSVRLHDERESDYYNYSQFWNYDAVGDSFTTINNSFNPTNPAHYSWDDLDEKVEILEQNGLDIYFRLGVSWPESSNYTTPPLGPPLDPDGINFTKFSELCRRTLMHYNYGWDSGFYYNIRQWEVWNEPGGIFWEGTPFQFYKMYEAVSTALKDQDSTIKVGALGALPADIVLSHNDYFNNFLQYVVDNQLHLDFYSWHLYGAVNPYGLKYWATYVRDRLDSLGLTETENHITEINYKLDEAQLIFNNNVAGATYLLSNLMTLQESPVEKVYWYPGLALVEKDSSGQARLKKNAYGLKTFSMLYQNTPLILESQGNDVIEGNWMSDTTNFMVLAAKDTASQKIYLAISNYNSTYFNFDIVLKNLPWGTTGQFKVTKNILREPSDLFTESVFYIPASDSVNFSINNMPSPSITLLRIEPDSTTSNISKKNYTNHITIAPNPFSDNVSIYIQVPQQGIATSELFNSNGVLIKKWIIPTGQPDYFINWDGKTEDDNTLPAGLYFLVLKLNGEMFEKASIVKIK
jgi:hypothetical protein